MNTTTRQLKVIGFSVPVTYAERINAITRRERRTKRAILKPWSTSTKRRSASGSGHLTPW